MSNEFTVFKAGEQFPIADTRGKQGFFFDYAEDNMAILTCCFPNMTKRESDLVLASHGTVGLFMYQGVIFFTAKFGKIDGDAAYNINLHEHPEKIIVKEPAPGTGLPLYIFAVDSATNILIGSRVCGLGTRFTHDFRKMTEEQRHMDFNEPTFMQSVLECQNRWTTKDLHRMATTYKLGTKEGESPLDILEIPR
ncbi:hypothetical protein [Selenomonas ruminantium]|uniref:Uncharacterized protein n=1 Tax=Selenomonas ruminantium TaxID=971 RepID=A0A1I0YAC9_SELRU|nr:hypothetical protein [Selenomonas ruminantium]SFB10221.1 hypothetical protein SAMN05216587_11146 [Selenomonas ruminantium]